MPKTNRILCPVDLSTFSLEAIDLAAMLAQQHQSRLILVYVAPDLKEEEAMYGAAFLRDLSNNQWESLKRLKPSLNAIEVEHEMLVGNPGPMIVQASRDADLVVMSTHGDTGLMRLLMGSVAQYVLRNADCPVILFKNSEEKSVEELSDEGADEGDQQQVKMTSPYVTDIMHQVAPVFRHRKMDEVLVELEKAREDAVPVVDDSGHCVGILTRTDIAHYHDLQRRYREGDETVIKEMFQVDAYGQRQPNDDFDQVHRHMTHPVVTIATSETCDAAEKLFAEHPRIHHLVVVDETTHPKGIVELSDIAPSDDPVAEQQAH